MTSPNKEDGGQLEIPGQARESGTHDREVALAATIVRQTMAGEPGALTTAPKKLTDAEAQLAEIAGETDHLNNAGFKEKVEQLLREVDAWKETGGGDQRMQSLQSLRERLLASLHELASGLKTPDDIWHLYYSMLNIVTLVTSPRPNLEDYIAEEVNTPPEQGKQIHNAVLMREDFNLLSKAFYRLHGASQDAIEDFQQDNPSIVWQDPDKAQQLFEALDYTYEIIKLLCGRELEVRMVPAGSDERRDIDIQDRRIVSQWLKDLNTLIMVRAGVISRTTPRTNQAAQTRRENKVKDVRRRALGH